MLKQILVIIIAICYTFGSAEVRLNFHYCGKVFQYVSLFSDKEKDSCCGKSGETDGCCKNDVVKCDVDDHKQTPKFFQFTKKTAEDTNVVPSNYAFESSEFTILIYRYDKLHPPPILTTKVYLDNCVFLI